VSLRTLVAQRSSWRLQLTWRRAVVAAVALLLLIPNSSVLEHRALIAVFLVALAAGRGAVFVRDWLPLVCFATLFVVLRQFAALSPLPRQGAAVVGAEAALFSGQMPSAVLQGLFYVPGRPGALDYVATGVHASYFFGFVLVGLAIWLFARERFRTYAAALGLTFALGLAGYFLLPTEPPWLASRDGLAPPIRRIIGETAQGTRLTAGVVAAGRAWQNDPDALGDPNPTAAMPSVHTAVTVVLALALWHWRPALGIAGAVYAAAMGFSLVYLGEHYVLDVLAGILCAVVASWIAGRWLPVPSAVERQAQQESAGETRLPAEP
jgi:membrane-associated phospholipid phosphatase